MINVRPLLLGMLLASLSQPLAWSQTSDQISGLTNLRERAEQGNSKAQTQLGYHYHTGDGVERDYAEALKWYRLAAEQGNADAQYNLGVAYAFGEGVDKDLTRASNWYQRAAEQGHKVAAFSLGLSYLYGDGVQQDGSQAAAWLRQSAEQGYTRAQVHLASIYHTGDGVPQDYEAAAYWYRQAAERGDATAQYNLGNLYRAGRGVPKDDDVARHWFGKAAKQEYTLAMAELDSLEQPARPAAAEPASTGFADMTLAEDERGDTGTDMTRSEPEASGDEAEATTAGRENPAATATTDKQDGGIAGFFGSLFGSDQHVGTEAAAVDVPNNSEWREPVAEEPAVQATDPDSDATPADQTREDSQTTAALALKDDPSTTPTGVQISDAARTALDSENYTEAIRLLQQQALNGNAAAETQLGNLYFQGRGIKQNYDRALLWYRRAAKRRHADAQYNLGNMYLLGEGVLQSDSKARDWYAKAAAQGHEAAANNLTNLKRRMANQQRYNPDNHQGPTQREMQNSLEDNVQEEAPAARTDTAPPQLPDTSPISSRRIMSPPLETTTSD